jgi:hypothetical protein
MTKQIDELMALFDKAANCGIVMFAEMRVDERYRLEGEFRSALEAALKPGEPVAWFDDTGQLRGRVSDEQLYALCANALATINSRNGWEDEPPAQAPKGLFVDLIAQHPGLAEELKTIDDAPMPTWAPPPRLTDEELMDSVTHGSGWMQLYRSIETAVRKQFLGVQE